MAYQDFEEHKPPDLFLSQEESRAINHQVFRCSSSDWCSDRPKVLQLLEGSDAEIVILRTKDIQPDSAEIPDSWITIPAGELVYWSSDINPEFTPIEYPFSIVDAHSDTKAYATVVEQSFADYRNHYSFNPLFNSLSPQLAYIDWAIRRAESTDQRHLSGLLLSNDVPVGAISGVQNGADVEIELAGIAPAFQGRGYYAHLISGFWSFVSNREKSRIVISTQEENKSVQKAWAKLGFKYEFSVFTTHLVRTNS